MKTNEGYNATLFKYVYIAQKTAKVSITKILLPAVHYRTTTPSLLPIPLSRPLTLPAPSYLPCSLSSTPNPSPWTSASDPGTAEDDFRAMARGRLPTVNSGSAKISSLPQVLQVPSDWVRSIGGAAPELGPEPEPVPNIGLVPASAGRQGDEARQGPNDDDLDDVEERLSMRSSGKARSSSVPQLRQDRMRSKIGG